MYLYTAFLLGLFGSLHCLGMCGPIALSLPLPKDNPWQTLRSQMWYQGGRIFSYGLLGTAAGMLGWSAQLAGLQGWLSILTGTVLALLCLASYWHFGKLLLSRLASAIAQRVQTFWPALYQRHDTRSFFLIGLLNGFLPCGLVYVALAAAANTEYWWHAVAFMTLFGLGTVPALALWIQGTQIVTMRLRSYTTRLIPALVLLVATLLIVRGMQLGIPYLSPASDKPCCCHTNPR